MLGAAEVSNDVAGKPVEQKLQEGETRFSPGPFSHVVRVHPGQAFRNVTIELLQDAKLRQSRAHWDQQRGSTSSGVARARSSSSKMASALPNSNSNPAAPFRDIITPAPTCWLPSPTSTSAANVEGQGAMPGHFKSGEAKWLPGAYSHSVTNTGHRLAKFVTLEFP